MVIHAARDPDGGLSIQVSDTGIGMSPEELLKAPQLFAQVDNAENKRYEGTGIGLPLAKRLVELHGGTLTIQSVKGKGTTVVVKLPPDRVVARTETLIGMSMPLRQER